ncbi:MAG: hypothetical protein AVDCRST_MAG77-4245, partial [uncultured Chloroflexi bacterium]
CPTPRLTTTSPATLRRLSRACASCAPSSSSFCPTPPSRSHTASLPTSCPPEPSPTSAPPEATAPFTVLSRTPKPATLMATLPRKARFASPSTSVCPPASCASSSVPGSPSTRRPSGIPRSAALTGLARRLRLPSS